MKSAVSHLGWVQTGAYGSQFDEVLDLLDPIEIRRAWVILLCQANQLLLLLDQSSAVDDSVGPSKQTHEIIEIHVPEQGGVTPDGMIQVFACQIDPWQVFWVHETQNVAHELGRQLDEGEHCGGAGVWFTVCAATCPWIHGC